MLARSGSATVLEEPGCPWLRACVLSPLLVATVVARTGGALHAQEDGSFHPGLLPSLCGEEIPPNRRVHVRRRERVWTRRGRMRLSARGAEDGKCLPVRRGRDAMTQRGALGQERSQSLCATPRGGSRLSYVCPSLCNVHQQERTPVHRGELVYRAFLWVYPPTKAAPRAGA